jgi:hypothetical protein
MEGIIESAITKRMNHKNPARIAPDFYDYLRVCF